ncbi:hypothetical protein [Leeuwenhoekiella nanhaiensis]|uniref:Lipocalin-like domain-containing protein n=1 Tax=Leeuwenhoekiella nanhaiensis TaxID=1655491 RepID=A0A2G1VQV9_9FLAO|nr:hypothetical protein [Leeuwenhoekiella nanhaiensis]PHQ29158.1 hypothetical protein CJ305_11150 [Leeuwenhoekiella nanhaiensis]
MKNLFLFALLLVFSVSCDEDNQDIIRLENSDLNGSWYNGSELDEGSTLYRFTYTFNLDGTFEGVSTFRDAETNELLGYDYKVSGDYELSRDSLTFFPTKQFYIAAGTPAYVPALEDLDIRDISERQAVGYKITENKSLLTIDFPPCGPTENCIDKINYSRLED